MIELLVNHPLLLLFVVAGIGYPLGRIRVAGCSLGVAAVLFAGIAIGSLDPRLSLPPVVYLLGLVLFVYTIGLSSGPTFFAAFRRQGVRDNLLVTGMICLAFGLTLATHHLLGLRPALTGGLFAGALTNTPALAAELEFLELRMPAAADATILADPVVGYSIAYPLGVLGVLVAIVLAQRLWRVDYQREIQRSRELGLPSGDRPLESRVARVVDIRPGDTPGRLLVRHNWDVVFGRLQRDGELMVADLATPLQPGDLLSMVGTAEELDQVVRTLGEPSDQRLTDSRQVLDFRRVFVSNPQVAGRRLADLDLMGRYGAVVTRVRRGDADILPHADTVLELGDRVRVLTRRDRLDEVSRLFGDSYRSVSEIDILSFSLGVALGLLVGSIPIPLPGGLDLRLGLAGGPLIVALLLGWRGRTGPVVWTLPYGANLTLRQIGLILFLAGVGTRAGYSFVDTLTQGDGLAVLAAGGAITFVTAFGTLWLGHRWLKIPMSVLTGMVAGQHTQPAVLGFAVDQTKNDLPNIGYTSVYPVATVVKIILAQVLLTILL